MAIYDVKVNQLDGTPASLGDYKGKAVLIVNVVGSLVGGIVLGLVQAGLIGADLRLILLSGFAGGLTTFSTFSVETIQLLMVGRWRSALVSVVANLVLGVGAVVLGCCAVLWIAG